MANFVYFENCALTSCEFKNIIDLKQNISSQYGVPLEDLFVVVNGKTVCDDFNLKNTKHVIRAYTKILGGKGGFGSMLRAIGAQIEKTTNREACRDLSGRRLRDINEEKRLRKWLDGQEEREREAAERKQKKIERLISEPKINVNLSPVYEKERQELPERVSAAVDAGWQAAGSSNDGKRKADAETQSKGKKKARLWIDADLSDCSSLSEEEEEERIWSLVFFLSMLVLVACRPQEFDYEDEGKHAGNGKDEVGRVQIKVYRGPTKNDGYAPWGFWVKQPSDEEQ